jgi:hypothetical protein
VEIGDSIGVFGFSRSGRVYGVLVMVRGRAHIFGACRRGFFWRFGFPIFNPVPGYFDSVFGLRTKIGEISFLLEGGMKDETIKLRFGNHGICCNLFISRHGLFSCNLIAMDRQIFTPIDRKNSEIFSEHQMEDVSFYLSNHKE